MLKLVIVTSLAMVTVVSTAFADKTEQELCAAATSFRGEQNQLTAASAQLQKEANPIKQKEGTNEIAQKRNTLSKRADDWFKEGGQKAQAVSSPGVWEHRIQNFGGVVSKIYPYNLGGDGITLEASLPCPTPIILKMLFPPATQARPGNIILTIGSNFDQFRPILKEISQGDKISFSGFLVEPGLEWPSGNGFFGQGPVTLTTRVNQLKKN